MLVSKIKPCMSKFTLSHGETANGSLNQSMFIRWKLSYLDNCGNSRANTCLPSSDPRGKSAFISSKPIAVALRGARRPDWWLWITLCWSHGPSAGDASFKCLPYQMSMVRDMPTMFVTGNGESGFDSGEGAWETATTSKEGSRRATYPLPARGGSDEK